MRALVWNQPYGSMMLLGKEFETRGYSTNVRGEVLICTAKKPYDDGMIMAIAGFRQFHRMRELLEKERKASVPTADLHGYAIGVGTLYDCFPLKEEHEDKAFVKYHPAALRWCWKFTDVRRIQPFPWKFGKQGWLFVPETELEKIKYI